VPLRNYSLTHSSQTDRTGQIVLDGDPAPSPPPKRAQPSLMFGPCLLWPNGRMQGRPQTRASTVETKPR